MSLPITIPSSCSTLTDKTITFPIHINQLTHLLKGSIDELQLKIILHAYVKFNAIDPLANDFFQYLKTFQVINTDTQEIITEFSAPCWFTLTYIGLDKLIHDRINSVLYINIPRGHYNTIKYNLNYEFRFIFSDNVENIKDNMSLFIYYHSDRYIDRNLIMSAKDTLDCLTASQYTAKTIHSHFIMEKNTFKLDPEKYDTTQKSLDMHIQLETSNEYICQFIFYDQKYSNILKSGYITVGDNVLLYQFDSAYDVAVLDKALHHISSKAHGVYTCTMPLAVKYITDNAGSIKWDMHLQLEVEDINIWQYVEFYVITQRIDLDE